MKVVFFMLLLPLLAYGGTQVYEGEARLEGQVVYREKHTVEFDSGKVVKSLTEYTAPDGKIIGRLSNSFTQNLSVPEHVMEDLLHQEVHGVRYDENEPVMYNKEGKKEETAKVGKADAKGKLVVAGQGLHYYTLAHMEDIIGKKKLDLLFLIPGRLDAYNFYMKVKKSSSEMVVFEIEIDNWFLRMFAPKLTLVYDRKKGRLLNYRGLSNLRDKKKKIMNVEITYKYQN